MNIDNKNTNKITTSFQGEPGAYSEEALFKFFGDKSDSIPCFSFADILENVVNDTTDYAILPVENSIAGTVVQACDELLKFDLRIQQEIILKVEHCLMAYETENTNSLLQVYSHPQALSQCHNNIKRYKLNENSYHDTAGAANHISNQKNKSYAAIASKLAAKTYNLNILINNFEDEPFNYTRFFLMSKADGQEYNINKKYKTSIIFSTRHKPHALVDVLNCLASYKINMSKIESRPSRNRAWDYLFFVDFDGHEEQESVQKAFIAILKHTSFLKVLGSYQTCSV